MPVELAGSLEANIAARFSPVARYLKDKTGMQGAGETGFFKLPLGVTHHWIELNTNITDPSQIKIWIELNGDHIVRLTGTEMKMLEAYKQYPGTSNDGRYVIRFSDLIYRTKVGIRTGELVTFPTDDVYLHVEIASGFVGTPSIVGRSHMTNNLPGQRRIFVPEIYSTNWDAVATSNNEYKWDKGGVDNYIKRVHFKRADVNRCDLWRGDRKIHELKPDDNDFDLGCNGLAPQAGYFHFDPTQYGLGADGLMVTTDLRFDMDFGATGAVGLLIEKVRQVENLAVPAK